MTVYEMIQELVQYDADMEVEVNVFSNKYPTTVKVDEDVEEGQKTDVDVEFDEYVSEFGIDDYKKYTDKKFVRILAEVK